jgi:hypothetical protein
VAGRGLEHVERALHVDLAVARGIGHRGRHAGLRGQVVDRLGPRGVDGRVEPRPLRDVDLLEVGAGRDVLGLAGRQVVDHDDAVPVGEQRCGYVRADEPRAAGDDRGSARHLAQPGNQEELIGR